MINLPKCVVKQASTYKVGSVVSRLEEGTALVSYLEDGVRVVGPSTGVAGEIFQGFAQNRFNAPEYAIMFEELSVPGAAPYTVKLSRVPYGDATNRHFTINGAPAAIASGAPAAGQVGVAADGTLTFNSADTGKAVTALYRYALTQSEAVLLFGGEYVPFTRSAEVQTTSIEVGIVHTDKYVVGDDWAAAGALAYLAANGMVTTDDTGTKIGNIVALPSVSGGFLGVEISI